MVSFAEPEKLALIFDGDNRQEWQRTDYIMQHLAIAPDEVIADVGAGTGYFSAQFIRHSKAGKVYAIDLEPNMQAYLAKRFTGEPRVQVRGCAADNPQLPEDVDSVFIANSYRFMAQRPRFLAHLAAQLAPSARVVIVDYKGSNARVSPEMAIAEVIAAGFEIYHFDRDGCPDHYLLSFRPQQG